MQISILLILISIYTRIPQKKLQSPLVYHTDRFSKLEIPIYNSEVPETADRETRRRTRSITKRYAFQATAKRYFAGYSCYKSPSYADYWLCFYDLIFSFLLNLYRIGITKFSWNDYYCELNQMLPQILLYIKWNVLFGSQVIGKQSTPVMDKEQNKEIINKLWIRTVYWNLLFMESVIYI